MRNITMCESHCRYVTRNYIFKMDTRLFYTVNNKQDAYVISVDNT